MSPSHSALAGVTSMFAEMILHTLTGFFYFHATFGLTGERQFHIPLCLCMPHMYMLKLYTHFVGYKT